MSEIFKRAIFWINKNSARVKLLLFYFPIAAVLGFLLVKIEWNNVYINITQEDHFVENAQFIAYFAASILAALAGSGCLKKGHLLNGVLLFVFAALLLFVSMEEIAWGQRLFSAGTPEWFLQNNVQKETTVHNLKPVQSLLHLLYVLTGSLFSFWWIPAKHIAAGKRLNRELKAAIRLFSPGWYLMTFFLPVVVIYAYFLLPAIQINEFAAWYDQEPAELLLALGFLLFVVAVMLRLKRADQLSPAGESVQNGRAALDPEGPTAGMPPEKRGQILREAALIAVVLLAALGCLAWRYMKVRHDSESLWKRKLSIIPSAALDHNSLANDLAAQGKTAEAVKEYNLAVEAKPDYADAHYNLALAFAKQGRMEEAILHYKAAIKAQPDYALAHNNLANALAAQGKLEEAVLHYKLALQARPGLAEAHYNLANALAAQGKLEEAVLHYELTLKARPDLALAYNNLANALARQGRLEEAVRNYRQALKLNPGYAQAAHNLEIVSKRLKP